MNFTFYLSMVFKCNLFTIKHYANMSVQYTAIFHGYKNDYFQMKNCNIFLIFAPKHRLWVHVITTSVRLIFAPKHRLWVHVRTASVRKKVYPCNPSFTIKKWGVRGCSLHGLVFVMKWPFVGLLPRQQACIRVI